MDKESYLKKIESYIMPSVGLRAYLNYILHEDAFKRKKTIKLSDKYFSPLLFISSGTLRLYSLEEDGETTIMFWYKNQFLIQMLMLHHYCERELYIEFLEDSKIIGYPEKHSANLFKLFPEYRELASKIYQAQIATLIQHSISLAQLDSSERFESLMKSNPELFNTCDLKIIANYLGIHPKVLSLLRSKAVKR
jgi:CRP-like cAMP-binding protein